MRHSWTFCGAFFFLGTRINSSPHLTKITMEINFTSLFVTNTQVGEKRSFRWAHCDLVPFPSVAPHKWVIIPERIKLPLMLSLHWVSFEWPTLTLLNYQFSCSSNWSHLFVCLFVCLCLCSTSDSSVAYRLGALGQWESFSGGWS